MRLNTSALPLRERLKKWFIHYRLAIISLTILAIISLCWLLFSTTFCASKYGPLMDTAQKMANSLTENLTGGKWESEINRQIPTGSVVSTINSVLQGWALSILVMLWLPSLITAFVNQQAYTEIVLKKLLILGVGVFLIINSERICHGITGLGYELVNNIGTVDSNANIDLASEMERLAEIEEANIMNDNSQDIEYDESGVEVSSDSSIVAQTSKQNTIQTFLAGNKIIKNLRVAITTKLGLPFKFIVDLLIPWICMQAAYVMVVIACISRNLEILILTALSPIPFCILTNEPLGSGSGTRFIKNMVALSLQGAVLLIICRIGTAYILNSIGTSITLDSSGEILRSAAVALAVASIMLKSLSISQKAIGLQ